MENQLNFKSDFKLYARILESLKKALTDEVFNHYFPLINLCPRLHRFTHYFPPILLSQMHNQCVASAAMKASVTL